MRADRPIDASVTRSGWLIQLVWLAAVMLLAAMPFGVIFADAYAVNLTTPAVIPFPGVMGGTDASNNAKSNANGGYFSEFDNISQFSYPAGHSNQLGNTAMVNDTTTYFDAETWQGGQQAALQRTGVPAPDAGCGDVAWWPSPGDWVSYQLNVTQAGTYTVLYRFSTAWGPTAPVIFHMTIDGVSSGPVTMQPDDKDYWTTGFGGFERPIDGWWGHNYVPATMPSGWNLAVGNHVLTVKIDSWPSTAPGPSTSGPGDIWIHYFKVFAGGTAVAGQVPAPTFSFAPALTASPRGPVAAGPVTVTIADADASAVIYYTSDGTTPTATSTRYTVPFTISSLGLSTIQAIAIDTTSSPVASTSFTIDQPPTVATAATAAPSPVAGTTTSLSVLGAWSGSGGQASLSYTWSVAGTAPATVRFSPNGTNAAQSATATFSAAGSYAIQAAIFDPYGLSVTSTVVVVVDQTATGIAVTPPTVWLASGASFTFTAAATDQFGTAIAGTPTVSWSAGGGTVSAGGQYTAGPTAGPYQVTATSGSSSGSATVVVTAGYAVSINFQPRQSPPFGNNLSDSGLPFGDRGNGQSYGWNQDLSSWARERQGKGTAAPDAGHDRLICMQRTSNAIFTLAVPNGSYLVHILCGDPTYCDSTFGVAVEGTVVVAGTASSSSHWIDGSQTVTVSNGLLSVTNATGAVNNKICQIDVSAVPAASN
jgi:hypothetical protein